MQKEELTAHQQRLWRLGAAAAPVIQLASGCPWTAAAAAALGAALLQRWMPEEKPGRIRTGLRRVLVVLALAQALELMSRFWESQERWMPVIFLGLAAWGAGKGKTRAAHYSIVLSWLTGILLGTTLLSAVPEIRLENLGPVMNSGGEAVTLLAVMLLTVVGTKTGKGRERPYQETGLLALTAAVCLQGALSWKIVKDLEDPFYEISRCVSYFGSLKRFESLAILGMLTGGFLWLSYLLTIGEKRDNRSIWETAIAGAVLYILHIGISSYVILGGILIEEYILPFGSKIQNRKNRKKDENTY